MSEERVVRSDIDRPATVTELLTAVALTQKVTNELGVAVTHLQSGEGKEAHAALTRMTELSTQAQEYLSTLIYEPLQHG